MDAQSLELGEASDSTSPWCPYGWNPREPDRTLGHCGGPGHTWSSGASVELVCRPCSADTGVVRDGFSACWSPGWSVTGWGRFRPVRLVYDGVVTLVGACGAVQGLLSVTSGAFSRSHIARTASSTGS